MHMVHAYDTYILSVHNMHACILCVHIICTHSCCELLSHVSWSELVVDEFGGGGFPKGRRRSAPVGASGGSGGRFASGSPPSLPVRRGELIARISCMHIMHAYHACMHSMHALFACLICMHSMHACMHKIHACMPAKKTKHTMHASMHA